MNIALNQRIKMERASVRCECTKFNKQMWQIVFYSNLSSNGISWNRKLINFMATLCIFHRKKCAAL